MKEYIVELPSGPATLQLSDEDAESWGERATPIKRASAANKGGAALNKQISAASDKQAAAAAEAFGTK